MKRLHNNLWDSKVCTGPAAICLKGATFLLNVVTFWSERLPGKAFALNEATDVRNVHHHHHIKHRSSLTVTLQPHNCDLTRYCVPHNTGVSLWAMSHISHSAFCLRWSQSPLRNPTRIFVEELKLIHIVSACAPQLCNCAKPEFVAKCLKMFPQKSKHSHRETSQRVKATLVQAKTNAASQRFESRARSVFLDTNFPLFHLLEFGGIDQLLTRVLTFTPRLCYVVTRLHLCNDLSVFFMLQLRSDSLHPRTRSHRFVSHVSVRCWRSHHSPSCSFWKAWCAFMQNTEWRSHHPGWSWTHKLSPVQDVFAEMEKLCHSCGYV